MPAVSWVAPQPGMRPGSDLGGWSVLGQDTLATLLAPEVAGHGRARGDAAERPAR